MAMSLAHGTADVMVCVLRSCHNQPDIKTYRMAEPGSDIACVRYSHRTQMKFSSALDPSSFRSGTLSKPLEGKSGT